MSPTSFCSRRSVSGTTTTYVPCVVDTSQSFYYKWLAVVSCTILYNIVMIIARSVFWQLNNYCPWLWFLFDYICDFVYIVDMVIHARTGKYKYKKQKCVRDNLLSDAHTDYKRHTKSNHTKYSSVFPRLGFLRVTHTSVLILDQMSTDLLSLVFS